jgi:hypothetical protein
MFKRILITGAASLAALVLLLIGFGWHESKRFADLRAKQEHIKPGMTSSQVVQVLGKPDITPPACGKYGRALAGCHSEWIYRNRIAIEGEFIVVDFTADGHVLGVMFLASI